MSPEKQRVNDMILELDRIQNMVNVKLIELEQCHTVNRQLSEINKLLMTQNEKLKEEIKTWQTLYNVASSPQTKTFQSRANYER